MYVTPFLKSISMQAITFRVGLVCILCSLFCCSCSKNDAVKLVDPLYKDLQLSCGSDFEIPMLTANWNIEAVQYLPSGETMPDKDGNPLALAGHGTVEAANGWLTLIRKSNDKFILKLEENFDKSNDRKFIICINEAGRRDYITVVQQAAPAYELVKYEFTEINEQRNIYVSNAECIPLTLHNDTPEAVWKPTGSIFEKVVESSVFESDSYGAFEWMPEEGIDINVPELIVDNFICWDNRCAYKRGNTTVPLIKDIPNGNKILVPPYETIYLKGEITYCKRICNYTLTIRNTASGTQFQINGIWTQIIPISSNTIAT